MSWLIEYEGDSIEHVRERLLSQISRHPIHGFEGRIMPDGPLQDVDHIVDVEAVRVWTELGTDRLRDLIRELARTFQLEWLGGDSVCQRVDDVQTLQQLLQPSFWRHDVSSEPRQTCGSVQTSPHNTQGTQCNHASGVRDTLAVPEWREEAGYLATGHEVSASLSGSVDVDVYGGLLRLLNARANGGVCRVQACDSFWQSTWSLPFRALREPVCIPQLSCVTL